MSVARQGSEGGAQPFQREDSAQQAGSSLSCQTLDLKTQGTTSANSQCKQSWSDMFNPWGRIARHRNLSPPDGSGPECSSRRICGVRRRYFVGCESFDAVGGSNFDGGGVVALRGQPKVEWRH